MNVILSDRLLGKRWSYHRRLWILVAGLALSTPGFALPDKEAQPRNPNKFYSDHARGWHWYEDPQEEEEKQPEPKAETAPESEEEDVPPEVKELREIQAKLQELREIAVMNPTHKNVEAYMRFQYEQMERAQAFADSWKRVLYVTPDLDRTIQHPTTQLANLVRKQEVKEERADELKDVGKKFGIFFFFKGSCPYCHKFGPILASFARDYGINVIPISMDGGVLPDFQDPLIDRGLVRANQLKVQSVPSIFLVDPKDRDVIPLANGLIGRSELEQRVLAMSKHEVIEEIKDNDLATRIDTNFTPVTARD